MNKKFNFKLPFLFALVLALGMYLGILLASDKYKNLAQYNFTISKNTKLTEVLNTIRDRYVDSLNYDSIEAEAINRVIASLDPHSSYISQQDLSSVNESLEGNFQGVGIEFYLLNDTIYVVNAISGGPSDKLGIRTGDKIVMIADSVVAGKKITNTDVVKKLRGKQGTKVKVGIKRTGVKELVNFVITRDNIPLNSIDAYFMLDTETSYIKLSKFSETTSEEIYTALTDLKQKGTKHLILDLRGNGGGYLSAATDLANQFLQEGELIVYTQGRNIERRNYYSNGKGLFKTGKLVVLIDESSASASEIVAGAVQDLDRGTIIGRRSFGKGLVQDQMEFGDGSALRLTISRYYTPAGRCIQKPYNNGTEAYELELNDRFNNGELTNGVENSKSDSTQYKTKKGRTVYGGGGIQPDIFIKLDTSFLGTYYLEALSRGKVIDFAYAYFDKNKETLNTKYASLGDYINSFSIDATIWKNFEQFYIKDRKGRSKSNEAEVKQIKTQIKALIARQVWGDEGYYKTIVKNDEVSKKALEIIASPSL